MSSSLPPSSPCHNSEQDDPAIPVEAKTAVDARHQKLLDLAKQTSADSSDNEVPTIKLKR